MPEHDEGLSTSLELYARRPDLFTEHEKQVLRGAAMRDYDVDIDDLHPSALAEMPKQLYGGLISGYTAFLDPVAPAKTEWGGFAYRIGHLMGFVGSFFGGGITKGITAGLRWAGVAGKASRVGKLARAAAGSEQLAKFRSVPMFAADVSSQWLLKRKAAQTVMKHLVDKPVAQHMLESSLHLGIASSVSSLKEGWEEGIRGAAWGMAFGAAFARIGNIGVLKERTSLNTFIKAAAGSMVQGVPALVESELGEHPIPIAVLAEQFLLGAYFGSHSTSAIHHKAYKVIRATPEGKNWWAVASAENPLFDALPEAQKAGVLKVIDEMAQPKETQGILYRILTGIKGGEKLTDAWKRSSFAVGTKIQDADRGIIGEIVEIDPKKDGFFVKSDATGEKHFISVRKSALVDWKQDEPGESRDKLDEVVQQKNRLIEDQDIPGISHPIRKMVQALTGTEGVTRREMLGHLQNLNSKLEELARKFSSGEDTEVWKEFEALIEKVAKNYGREVDPETKGLWGAYFDDAAFSLSHNHRWVDASGKLRTYEIDKTGRYRDIDNNIRDAKGVMKEIQLIWNDPNIYFMVEGSATGRGARRLESLASLDKLPLQTMYNSAREEGYYPFSGWSDHPRVVFVKFVDTPEDAARITKHLRDTLGPEEYQRQMEHLFKVNARELGFGSKEEFMRMFVSNVMHTEKLFGKDIAEFFGGKKGYLKNVLDFNKRVQIFFTDFAPLNPKRWEHGKLRYALVKDYVDLGLTDKAGNPLGKAVSDGAILISREFADKLFAYLGLPKGGGFAKPFIIDRGSKALGTLLGKAAFHVVEGPLAEQMAARGIDMIVHESAAKMVGERVVGDISFENGKLKLGSPVYEMLPQALRMSRGIYDDPMKIKKGFARLAKQLLMNQATLNSKPYRDWLTAKSKGTPEANAALDAWVKLPSDYKGKNEALLDKLIEDHMEEMGLQQILDTMTSNAAFRKKARRYMLFREAEDFTLEDFIDDVDLQGVARAIDFERSTAILDFLKFGSTSDGPAMIKLSRNVMENAMIGFFVRRVTRPKLRSGAKAIMRTFDISQHKNRVLDDHSFYLDEAFRDMPVYGYNERGQREWSTLGKQWELFESLAPTPPQSDRPIMNIVSRSATKMEVEFEIDRVHELRTISQELVGNNPGRVILLELLQNSLDAGATKLGVIIDRKANSVRFVDNGSGMLPETVKTQYLVLSARGTKGGTSAGGFGRAKGSFLLWPERAQLRTIKDGILTSFDASQEEFLNRKFNLSVERGQDPNKQGTELVLTFPKNKTIELTAFEQALEESVKRLRRDVEVNLKKGWREDVTQLRPAKDFVWRFPTEKINVGGTEFEIRYEWMEPNPYNYALFGGYSPEVILLNKGIPVEARFSWDKGFRENPDFRVIIDAVTTPDVNAEDYPFIRNRRELRDIVQNELRDHFNDFVKNQNDLSLRQDIAALKELLGAAQTFNGVKFIPDGVPKELRQRFFDTLGYHQMLLGGIGRGFAEFNKYLSELEGREVEIAMAADPKTHGWRPNKEMDFPEIYAINPFSIDEAFAIKYLSMEPGADLSRVRANGIVHTLMHEYVHNKVAGHDEHFTMELSRLYIRFSHKRLGQLEDIFFDILTKEKESYDKLSRDLKILYEQISLFGMVAKDRSSLPSSSGSFSVRHLREGAITGGPDKVQRAERESVTEVFRRELRKKIQDDVFDMAVLRVPMDDISGAAALRFAGFTGYGGSGIMLSSNLMDRMGGADLDIDAAFIYQGLPRETLELLRQHADDYSKLQKAFPKAKDMFIKGDPEIMQYLPGRTFNFGMPVIPIKEKAGRESLTKELAAEGLPADVIEDLLAKRISPVEAVQRVLGHSADDTPLRIKQNIEGPDTKRITGGPELARDVAGKDFASHTEAWEAAIETGAERIEGILRRKEKPSVGANPDLIRQLAMFSPYHRVRLGHQVSQGRNKMLGLAVANRAMVHALYDRVQKAGGTLELPLQYGDATITFTVVPDNGWRFRGVAQAAINAAADIGKYGGMVSPEILKGIFFRAAFASIRYKNPRKNIDQELLDGSKIDPKKGQAAISDDLIGFVSKTLYKVDEVRRYTDANRKLYGKDYRDGRAYTFDEMQQAARDFPDKWDVPLKAVANTIAGLQYNDRLIHRYLRMPERARKVFDEINKIAKTKVDVPVVQEDGTIVYEKRDRFPFLPDGFKVPWQWLAKRLDFLNDFFSTANPDAWGNLLRGGGPSEIARSSHLWKIFLEKYSQLDGKTGIEHFMNYVARKAYKEAYDEAVARGQKQEWDPERIKEYAEDRAEAAALRAESQFDTPSAREEFIRDFVAEIEDFVSSRLEDMASLKTVEHFFLRSGLTEGEAKAIFADLWPLKEKYSTYHKQRRSEGRFNESPGSLNKIVAEFNQIRQKWANHVYRANQAPGPDGLPRNLTTGPVDDFVSAAFISSFIKGGKTEFNRLGVELANETVIKRFAGFLDDALTTTTTTFERGLGANWIAVNEEDARVKSVEHRYEYRPHFGIIFPENFDPNAPISKKGETMVHNLLAQLREMPSATADAFMGFVRRQFNVAQPGDLTIHEMDGLNHFFTRLRRGPGIFNWLFGDRKKGPVKFNFWTSLQFVSTTADNLKRDDFQFLAENIVDESGRLKTPQELKAMQPLLHVNPLTQRLENVYANTSEGISSFGQIINIVNRGEAHAAQIDAWMEQKLNEELSWVARGIRQPGKTADEAPEFLRTAFAQMEADGAKAHLERLRAERDENMAADLWPWERKMLDEQLESAERVAKQFAARAADRNIHYNLVSQAPYDVSIEGKVAREFGHEIIRSIQTSVEKIFRDGWENHISLRANWIEKNLPLELDAGGRPLVNLQKAYGGLKQFFRATYVDPQLRSLTYDESRLMLYLDYVHEQARNLSKTVGRPTESSVRSLRFSGLNKQLERFGVNEGYDVGDLKQFLAGYLAGSEGARGVGEETKPYTRGRRQGLLDLDEPKLTETKRKDAMQILGYFKRGVGRKSLVKRVLGENTYSQFQMDLLFAAGRLDAMRYHSYRLMMENPWKETGYLEGYWPHMDYSKKAINAYRDKVLAELDEKVQSGEMENDQYVKEVEGLTRAIERVQYEDRNSSGLMNVAIIESLTREGTETLADRQSHSVRALQDLGGGMTPAHVKHRRNNLDGYSYNLNVINKYFSTLTKATMRNLIAFQARRVINSVVRNQPHGEMTSTWVNWYRMYLRDALGGASLFTDAMLNDPRMKLRYTPYYWLSDHFAWVLLSKTEKFAKKLLGFDKIADVRIAEFRKKNGRAPNQAEKKQMLDELWETFKSSDLGKDMLSNRLRGFSNLEGRWEMATLLFHSKTAVTNIMGGSINNMVWTGARHMWDARKLSTWQRINPHEFKSMADVWRFVERTGAVEEFIIHEGSQVNPRVRADWDNFMNDVLRHIKKDPEMEDTTLFELARKHNITEDFVRKSGWFMQKSERHLRGYAFLSTYLQAREMFEPLNRLPYDTPYLIEVGKKGIAATQFLYSNANRPAFARTNLGKIFTRFKLWTWSSVRFRNQVYQEAADRGFKPRSLEFERLQRLMMADAFVVGLASLLPYTIFEYSLPAPFSYFQDFADWIFGDRKEKERAFFATSMMPKEWAKYAAPINLILPPAARIFKGVYDSPAFFGALFSGDIARMGEVYTYTLFPWGRMSRDVLRSIQSPSMAFDWLVGVPLHGLERWQDKKGNEKRWTWTHTYR